MRKYIDSVSKTNELRLLLKHPSHKYNLLVVLEGETDIKLFRSLLKSECISLESVDGKLDLLRVVDSLRSEGAGAVIGICDADFDHIKQLANDRETSGVYVTDLHDAEMMMIESPSLQSFIDEYSNHDNHSELSESLRDSVLTAACALGVFRLMNTDGGMNLNFKGLNFTSFVHIDKLKINIDIDHLIKMLVKRSKSLGEEVTEELLLNEYRSCSEVEYPKSQLCCGHDVANIIAMIYSQKWAACINNINKDKVEQALRIGYSLDEFRKTRLFKKLVRSTESMGFDVKDANNCINSGSLMLSST